MPYDNLPESEWGAMDQCVNDVMGKGHDKQSAIAICYTSISEHKEVDAVMKATAEDNNLPDSAFLYVESGGEKDSEGKTVPRSLRHLPYKTASGAIDLPRLRNALSRLGQSNTGTTGGEKWLTASLRDSLRAKAEKILTNATKEKANKEIHYRHCAMKAITDAPNLRGEDAQACINCKFFQYLPSPHDNYATEAYPEPMMMQMKDLQGICAEYEFETDGEWVCDSWAEIPPPAIASAKESQLAVFKQNDGKWRWVMVTSSAFKDRDGQIVSQQALEDDTAMMNTNKQFGTVDWWHLYALDGNLVSGRDLSITELERAKPIRLGECDFSAMHDLASVESGTFDDDFIGQRFGEHQNELAVSRSFLHPINEPDADGVYHHIATFSRAILPRGKEANLITRFVAAKEKNMSMIADKITELVSKLGGDAPASEKVKSILEASTKDQAALLAANVAHKDEAPATNPEKPADDKGWFIADMTPAEFGTLIVAAMQKANEPLIAQLAQAKDAQAATLKETGAGIVAEIAKVIQKQDGLDARLKQLEGEVPRAFRASQDPSTVVKDGAALKDKKPGDDPQSPYIADFIGRIATGEGMPVQK